MRIIAGSLGGRKLEVPKNQNIRPTSDKIRGSIFNALQSRMSFEGTSVIDICCGTGALGLEALSRGARHCTFIDKSRTSLDLAKNNAHNLDVLENCTFLTQDCTSLRKATNESPKASLFFCDPPYKQDLIQSCLASLQKCEWLNDNAIGVLESEKHWSFENLASYEVLSEKTYGDTKIIYLVFRE